MNSKKKSVKQKLSNGNGAAAGCSPDTTLLHQLASRGEKTSLVKHLNGDGIKDLDVADKTGKTPLMHCILGEWIDCVEVLLKAQANINKTDMSGKNALHFAVHKGNLKCVKLLLSKGANCRTTDNEGLNALHICARHTNAKCLNLILKHLQPGEIDVQDLNKRTALHWSSYHGHLEPIKLLLKHGSNVLIPDIHGKTPLHFAASAKGPEAGECVKYILDSQPSMINWQDYDGRTALHLAVSEGVEIVVQILIANPQCKISAMDNLFRTPLHWAAVLGRQSIIKMLLEHSADYGMTDSKGATALHYCAKNNYSECVSALLKGGIGGGSSILRDEQDNEGRTALIWAAGHGADDALVCCIAAGSNIFQADKHGATALHAAAQNGHASTVKLLLAHGSDKNATDLLYLTPLFRACEYGHEHVLQVLFENGANIESKDTDGRSALHWAALSGHAHICSKLIKFGLNPDVVDKSGRSPLQCASYSGHVSCILVLIEHGADPNWQDHEGMTSLHWACSRGHVEGAKLLLEFQAHLNQMELSDDKYTPLDYALLENHEKVAQFLIEQGALSIRGIQDLAAVKIQAVFRGYRLRKTFSERRKLMIEHEKLMKEACRKKKTVEENCQLANEGDFYRIDKHSIESLKNRSRMNENVKTIDKCKTLHTDDKDSIKEAAALIIQYAWKKYLRFPFLFLQ
ncbi:DgyrCDS10113 [Dimorphilus gyrociliatus]|uniref:DgyrCDS10113 n=1 Tax=Dimorphilus gyrociliatus TaxID=2664684 RepID=A0A7I8VZ54_9ANNE|nr:DgyrCDS10113 [Dimorphilus gyrociliatus]